MTILEGKVGYSSYSYGSPAPIALAKNGSVVTRDDFTEAVMRGRVFAACNQTGVTTQAGLSATTPVLTLYNPASSGTLGRLWFTDIDFLVAFAAAAQVWLALNNDATASAVTGTAATTKNLKMAGSTGAQGNKLSCFTAATLPAAPVGLFLLGVGLTGAISTVPTSLAMSKAYGGSVLIMPNTALSFQTSTASGTNSALAGFTWEEEDL